MRDAEDPQVRLTVRGDLLCESSYGRFWQRQPWRRQKDRWLPGAGEEGSVKRQNTGFRAGKRFCVALHGGYMPSTEKASHAEEPSCPARALRVGRVSVPRVGVDGDGDHGPSGNREAVRVCGQRAQENSARSAQF